MSYTINDILENVKLKACVAIGTLITDDRLLVFVNDVLRTKVIPKVMKYQEDYLVKYEQHTITSSQSYIRIPSRAIGGKLHEIKLLDNNQFYNLPYLNSEDIAYSSSQTCSSPYGFYFKNNKLQLYPTVNANNVIQISYYNRPNKVVSLDSVGTITAIDGDVVTVSSVPSAFSADSKVDFIKHNSPYETIQESNTISSIDSTDITLSTSLNSDLEVGDYICLEEQAPVSQICDDFIPILEQMVAIEVLDFIGDTEYLPLLYKELDRLLEDIDIIFTPRVSMELKTIVPNEDLD